MSNVKFLYEGLEGATLTASAGTASGYDVENVKDRNPNTLWIANANTNNQTFKAQLASSRAVDTVIIDGINASALASGTASIKVQSSTDNSTWTDRYTFNDAALSGNTRLKCEFVSASALYWRLLFNDSVGSMAVAPQIGSILLGTRFEPTIPYDSDPEHGEEFDTVRSRALDKTPYGSQTVSDGIEQWKKMKWSSVDSTIQNGFLKLNHNTRGKLRAFYFIDTDDVIYLVVMVADAVIVKHHRYNIYDVSIEMEAFLPNTIQLS